MRKSESGYIFNNETHMLNSKTSKLVQNHFFFRSDLINEYFLVIKNLNKKYPSHVKIFAYPYYSSHNFWGPGNAGFWMAIITFVVGFTLCFITYTMYKRNLENDKTQYYLISNATAGSITSNSATKSNTSNQLTLKNEFRILPK